MENQEFTRKLASVQRILKVEKHPNADSLDICTVLGWKTITKRDEFKEGDLCVYIEIDSILPSDNLMFDFLKNKDGKMQRIRTIKLRGQISSGIIFPLNILNHTEDYGSLVFCDYRDGEPFWRKIEEGLDVTDFLEVIKYEPEIPAQLRGKIKGNRPDFIPRTDETRIQSLGNELLSKYFGIECFVTEKLDGTSASYFFKDGQYGVCSRNLMYQEDDTNTYSTISRNLNMREKLEKYGKNIVVQGEIIGPGIQGNKYKLSKPEFYAFNVYSINEMKFMSFNEFKKVCADLELKTVPIINEELSLPTDIDRILLMADGESKLCPGVLREGIVIRPLIEIMDGNEKLSYNGRLTFKVISNKFLLEE